MAARRGTFIVIEGTDGSGKGTQFQLLKERLVQAGYQVEAFDFPRYDQPSSYFVTQYLNGAYGKADDVGPYTASLFYALDRYEAASAIRTALDNGKIVLSNRFTGSSMGHQGTKFQSPEERRGYFIWLDNLEFEMLRIPRPDISFVLRVPADMAQQLIGQKETRSYTNKQYDIHEADRSHLERAVAVYDDLTQLFPKDFQRIDCVRGGQLLDIDTVQAMLWEKVSPLLPEPPQLEMPMPTTTPADAAAATPPDAAGAEMTLPDPGAAGPDAETGAAATNPDGAVFACTSRVNPAILAAVMASLSRSPGGLNARTLDAFVAAAERDEALLQRTIRTYDPDTIGRYLSQHVVAKDVSLLAAGTLVSGRRAAYSQPEAAYTRYEHPDSDGRYAYYIPTGLSDDAAGHYRQHLDAIFGLYSSMLPKLHASLQAASGVPTQGRTVEWQAALLGEARGILQAVLPLAATTTVGIHATASAFTQTAIRLRSDPLAEAQQLADAVLHELHQTIPTFIEDADQPEKGAAASGHRQATRAAVAALAAVSLPATNSASAGEAVQLAAIHPRNELDLVADILYEHANLPLHAVQQAVHSWTYSQKASIIEAYLGERTSRHAQPGRVLEKAVYTWDIVSSYAAMHELTRHPAGLARTVQAITPRYGYDVPAAVEAAGLADQFEACFDTSLKLYSLLQEAGYPSAAPYAVLQGHKQRWQATYHARQAFRLYEQPPAANLSAETLTVIQAMRLQLAEAHPLIGEAIQF